MSDLKGEECEVCGEFIPGFEYQRCCNTFDCGCRGEPVNACLCSEECYDKSLSNEEAVQ